MPLIRSCSLLPRFPCAVKRKGVEFPASAKRFCSPNHPPMMMLLIGMKMSFTKKPMNPITTNPRAVRTAILVYSTGPTGGITHPSRSASRFPVQIGRSETHLASARIHLRVSFPGVSSSPTGIPVGFSRRTSSVRLVASLDQPGTVLAEFVHRFRRSFDELHDAAWLVPRATQIQWNDDLRQVERTVQRLASLETRFQRSLWTVTGHNRANGNGCGCGNEGASQTPSAGRVEWSEHVFDSWESAYRRTLQ